METPSPSETLAEKLFLGAVEFVHTDTSGFEVTLFYKDAHNQLYHLTTFVDPFDYSQKTGELKPCPLAEKEVRRLVGEGRVEDYQRFYWD